MAVYRAYCAHRPIHRITVREDIPAVVSRTLLHLLYIPSFEDVKLAMVALIACQAMAIERGVGPVELWSKMESERERERENKEGENRMALCVHAHTH